jgi:PAS domain S-box-containing protein
MPHQPVNILIVDDRPEGILAVEAVLDDPSYRLVKASSGEEALKHLLEQDFALILLDVQMPGLDGFETAEIIKSRERTRHVPIIFVTAISKEETFAFKGYQSGAVDYILKPFDPYVLKSKVGVFVDLHRKTEQVKAQAALLREAEKVERERELARLELENLQRYRSLADAIPHLVWRAGAIGSFEYVNRGWVLYTGMTSDAAIGRGWQSAIHSEDLFRLKQVWNSSHEGEDGFQVECRILGCHNIGMGGATKPSYRWHLVRFVIERAHNGRHLGWIGTATDIEDWKRTEEKNAALMEDLRDAVQARDEFLSVASHELKTPLTPLRLQVQSALRAARRTGWESVPPERISKVIEVTDRQVERLARLVDDMLDVSRINVGRFELRKEKVDLCELVREMLDRLSEQLRSSRCQVSLKVDNQIFGNWDRLRLEQVILNLLTNAMKYGSGSPVEIRLGETKSMARLQITDHGIGISQDDQQRIFQRFERAVSAKHFGGLGLGLYIAQQIVRHHGGQIRVFSEVGSGSTFIVELPLEHTETESASECHAPEPESVADHGYRA